MRFARPSTSINADDWRAPANILHIAADVCPWGIGAILFQSGKPEKYFADSLRKYDHQLFNAQSGDSAHNTVWEALAVLQALRLWRTSEHSILKVGVRSLNRVVSELALDIAEFEYEVDVMTHIPGVSNVWPDAFSRLVEPGRERKEILAALASVERTMVPTRGS